ncbi:hypothetical protein FisN_6Lh211 [Fistulifera solaris]|uniref:Uncharacterized protein n=1 Tax=Fistulifera solaris TaxID=1519565 RepID=A0A1Z5J5Z1_FISSO|nr:hypothetical protein FisN_6Lh211 [Fistulifera solaris]|eukprot:GAX09415.1 hypothetical protein FisN_6Lh211 [Fistulifera solaris]
MISKSGNAGHNTAQRRIPKKGPQEVHWYPFYVAIFHDPPDNYYANVSKEELWWSRDFLEQRLFESLAGQMMDEEDREHKHRLLQMGQDVVIRRSHESVTSITDDVTDVPEGDDVMTPHPVLVVDASEQDLGDVRSIGSPAFANDDCVTHYHDKEQGEGYCAEHDNFSNDTTVGGTNVKCVNFVEKNKEDSDVKAKVAGQEKMNASEQTNTHNSNQAKHQENELTEHERSILEQTQAYVRQYNELVEKGENVSGMMTPKEVISAAQKVLQSSKSPQSYQNDLRRQSGNDEMTENEQKILAHTRAYVEQYNELARIGMNLQGMMTPEEAIVAAQALLGNGNPSTAVKQQQQISMSPQIQHSGIRTENHTYGPISPRSENPNCVPQNRHIRPCPPITHFSFNYLSRNSPVARIHDPFPPFDTTRMRGIHGEPPDGPNVVHDSQASAQRNVAVGHFHEASRVGLDGNTASSNGHGGGLYNPLDSRFWTRSKTNIPPSLKQGTKSRLPYKVRWSREYITFVGAPIYVIFDPREMWWTGPELHYIDMENQHELDTRETAYVFDQECEMVFDRIIDECQAFQDRRKNPLRDLSALWNAANLRKFITPSLIQGLLNGHRGLELGGLEGRREKTVEQYRIVFDFIDCNFNKSDSLVKKNRQESGLADAASDATLCDRVFAYMMGLADEMIMFGFDL